MDNLQKKRDEAAVALRAMLATAKEEARGLSAEEKTKYDRCLADINTVDELRKQDAEVEKLAQVEQLEQRTIETVTKGIVDNDKDTRAFEMFLRYGDASGLQRNVTEKRVMSDSVGATGGYLVPEKYATLLREYMATDNIIRQLATVERWMSDGAYPVVTSFGTSYLVVAGSAVTETVPTIAQKLISGYQFMYAVDVPVPLLNKSQYPIESNILHWMAQSIAMKQEGYFADGSGSGEPIGLIDAATQGAATAANSAITGDDILGWYHSVPYKHRGRASWLMADSSIQLIRKIKTPVTTSGSQQYLWSPGLGGNPDTLQGRPIYPSAGFAAFAAGEEIGVFGDIKQFIIADFGTPSLIRDPYTKAKYNEVSFVGCYVTDTALPVAEAVATLKVLA